MEDEVDQGELARDHHDHVGEDYQIEQRQSRNDRDPAAAHAGWLYTLGRWEQYT